MKIKYLFLICILAFSILLTAEIPAGYYDIADGLSGEQLKAALNNIIDNHVVFPYSSSGTDVWDILKESDRDPDNPDNLILFYTGWSVNAEQEYNGGTGWNREHVWAKSHGDFGTAMGPGTDTHHLRPCDITVNSARLHKDFDEGGYQYIDGDGTTDCYTDNDSWEPRDEVKGDVARIIFYMDTRYEGEHGELDLTTVDYVNSYPAPEHGKLSTLLEWNLQDPPDAFEMNRNDVVYSYQQNRNPYIDHPEYVAYIWGGDVPEDTTPPYILDVEILDSTTLKLDFSESLDPVSAQIESNYMISNGIGNPVVASISADGFENTIQLTVDPLTISQNYTLTINNIEDQHENIIASNTEISFTYIVTNDLLVIDFEEGLDDCITYDVTSYLNWERIDDDTGSSHPEEIEDGSWYFYMNNYGGDVAANDWLILPEMESNRFSNLSLSFWVWNKYSDESVYGLSLEYSTDYQSGDPTSAIWSTIAFTTTAHEEWEEIIVSDLTAIHGEDFTLAFHYTSSGTDAGETEAWGVDKIYLTGSNQTGISTPQNIRIEIDANNINLIWDEVPDASQYHIYSSDNPDKEFSLWEKVATVNAVTQWTDENPVSKRFYRVTAE